MVLSGLAIALLAGAARADAAIVTSTADSGAGSLREALSLATAGETISIPTDGDYAATSAELAVTTNVTIDGSGPNVRIVGDGNNRVFNVTASNVTISDLTVTGGGLAGVAAHGGGIANGAGTLLLRNVFVSGNSVTFNNGGVPAGGGVFNDTGTLQLVDSFLTGNTSSTTDGGGVPEGAGIANASGSVTLTRTRMTNNTASTALSGGIPEGGAIQSDGGRLDIVDSTIAGNTSSAGASGAFGEGGGIKANSTATTILTSNVSENHVTAANDGSAGGGIFQSQGSLAIVNSTVSGNTASGTSSSSGAGIFLIDAALQATNSTIASNIVSGAGSGGNLLAGGTATFRPRNTIVADGSAGTSQNCSFGPDATTQSQGNNLETLNDCGFTAAGDLRNTDPQLGSPQDNGGPTETRAIPPESPAINAGTNTGCPATDQRGVARPQDVICDIGAFERPFSADLAVTKAATPKSVPVGGTITYTIRVAAGGPDNAAEARLTDVVPARAELVSARPSQGSCPSAPVLVCNLGDLAALGTAQATVVVRPTRPGTLTNLVRVSGRRPDPNSDNNTSSVSVLVTALTASGVSASPPTFALGRALPQLSRRAPVGTTIRFRLSAPARVSLAFARPTAGRRVGRRCVKRTRRNAGRRHCTRYVRAGTLRVNGKLGANRLRFQGRLSRRRSLRPGRDRMTVTATDRFGNRSRPKRIGLRILPRRRR